MLEACWDSILYALWICVKTSLQGNKIIWMNIWTTRLELEYKIELMGSYYWWNGIMDSMVKINEKDMKTWFVHLKDVLWFE